MCAQEPDSVAPPTQLHGIQKAFATLDLGHESTMLARDNLNRVIKGRPRPRTICQLDLERGTSR